MLKHISAAIFLMAASFANAQVQIIESQPVGGRSSPPARSAPVDAAAQAEVFNQLQMLQQEVLELRGLVEQQSFEIRQLKQQRLDDYLDLDRRVSQLANSASSRPATSTAGGPPDAPLPSPTTSDVSPDGAPADELAAYRSAIDLVLKQRDLDAGANALLRYVSDFPSGHYSANAFYWLGQIYLQKNDQEQSKRWFERMVEQYPNHQKTPEAKFKLARVYHTEGKTAEAKRLMQEVASSDSTAASLARDFLQQNF